MPLNTQNSRITFKYSTISGETPSIAPSLDHTDGTWDPTSLYVGEFFLNAADDSMWIRTLNGIVPITSGSSSHLISTYVNKTGDTMTGDLYGTGFYGTNISGDTIYGITFSGGTYYGDGSNLTGITVSWNGGTVSGDTTFNSIVDFCGGGIKIDNIEVCSGSTLQIIGDTEMIGTLTTTNDLTVGGVIYGDGSGITGIPALSAITLDEVLIQGDTSTNGDINLTNGNITLTNGIFYGDGSGLTNISSSASTPSLSDVLLVGNTTDGSNIVLGTDKITDGFGDLFSIYKSEGQWNIEANTTDREGRFILRDGVADTQIYNRTYTGVDTFTQGRLLLDSSQVRLAASSVVSGVDGPDAVLGLIGTDYPMIDISTTDVDGNLANIHLEGNLIQVYGFDNIGSGFRGIEYNDDYSANYTNRSLVDKEYVDNNSLVPSGTIGVDVATTATTHPFNGYTVIGQSTLDTQELNYINYIPKRTNATITTATTTVLATVPLYDSSTDFFEFRYSMRNDLNGREVGTITAFYDVITDSVNFNRVGPMSIGDITGLDFDVVHTGTNLELVAITTVNNWTVYVHTTAYQSGYLE